MNGQTQGGLAEETVIIGPYARPIEIVLVMHRGQRGREIVECPISSHTREDLSRLNPSGRTSWKGPRPILDPLPSLL